MEIKTLNDSDCMFYTEVNVAPLHFQTMQITITSLLLCQNTLMNLLFNTASVLLYAAFASA